MRGATLRFGAVTLGVRWARHGERRRSSKCTRNASRRERIPPGFLAGCLRPLLVATRRRSRWMPQRRPRPRWDGQIGTSETLPGRDGTGR